MTGSITVNSDRKVDITKGSTLKEYKSTFDHNGRLVIPKVCRDMAGMRYGSTVKVGFTPEGNILISKAE